MIRFAKLSALVVLGHVSLASSLVAGDQRWAESKSASPPRKVVVATMIMHAWGDHPGLAARLDQVEERVAEAAKTADNDFGKGSLDLVVIPETIVGDQNGDSLAQAVRWDGMVRDRFADMARKFHTNIVACMFLDEGASAAPKYSNAAIVVDRDGKELGLYRKIHPVAITGAELLEDGIDAGAETPVFDCDFGKLGIQICFDVNFDDGWNALADKGAEIVVWPTASPARVQPAAQAERNRLWVVSSTWRNNAAIFEPTGIVHAEIVEPERLLVRRIDLSYALLPWSPRLRHGKLFDETFGDRAGYRYSERDDIGIFWSNDPETPVANMVKRLDLEEYDALLKRNLLLHEKSRARVRP